MAPTYDGRNRRRPDKIQISLVWLLMTAIGLIGYQIIDNQQNAVSRSKVEELVKHDEKIQEQLNNLQDQVNQILYEQRQTQKSLKGRERDE